MNSLTRFFLILLRLAIGWHFLFEGLEKIHSVNLGPTETSRPWTSKPYLREATGPLADFFRRQTGESDEEALALLAVRPLAPGEDPTKVTANQRIPPLLDKTWNEYFERFVTHFQLTDEQKQKAAGKLDQLKDQVVRWMLSEGDLRETDKTFAFNTIKVKESPVQRITAYRANVRKVRDLETRELPALGKDVEKQKLRALKVETNNQRTALLADLQKPLVEGLQGLLTAEQKQLPRLASVEQDATRPWWKKTRMEWIDWLTRYGLTVVGACLLLGLCTPAACLGGAGLLLLFYVTMPPFPWVPENIRAEGHYLFVNKNLIEMLALMVLMTLPTGRWVGLDGLLQFLNPWRRRRQALEQAANERLGIRSR